MILPSKFNVNLKLSSSGLKGRRRTYLTILELADHARF
jgi:hypothetical protein